MLAIITTKEQQRGSSGLGSLLRSPHTIYPILPPFWLISPGSFTKHKNCFRIFLGWLKFNEINQINEIFSSIFSDSRPHFRDFEIIPSEIRVEYRIDSSPHVQQTWHCFCNLKTLGTATKNECKFHLDLDLFSYWSSTKSKLVGSLAVLFEFSLSS